MYSEYFNYNNCTVSYTYDNYRDNCDTYHNNYRNSCSTYHDNSWSTSHYNGLNNCHTSHYNGLNACYTTKRYVNHINYNNPDEGGPQTITWEEWPEGEIPEYIEDSFEAIKELREKIVNLGIVKGQNRADGPYIKEDEIDDGDPNTTEFLTYSSIHHSYNLFNGVKAVWDWTFDTNLINLDWFTNYRLFPENEDWKYNGDPSQTTLVLHQTHNLSRPVMKMVGLGDNTANGGFDSNHFAANSASTYRFSMWMMKETNLTDGALYFGTRPRVATDNTNPYFWSGDLPALNTWYLAVGFVYGVGVAKTDLGGIYDTDGNKVLDCTAYNQQSGYQDLRIRGYLYYTLIDGTTAYFDSIRVDLVDGTEPTLDQLREANYPYGTVLNPFTEELPALGELATKSSWNKLHDNLNAAASYTQPNYANIIRTQYDSAYINHTNYCITTT